jgi:hypothetical protein
MRTFGRKSPADVPKELSRTESYGAPVIEQQHSIDSQAAEATGGRHSLSTCGSDVAVAMMTMVTETSGAGSDRAQHPQKHQPSSNTNRVAGSKAATVVDTDQLQHQHTHSNSRPDETPGLAMRDSFQVASKFASALSQFPALGPKVLLRRGLRLKVGGGAVYIHIVLRSIVLQLHTRVLPPPWETSVHLLPSLT